MAEEERRCPGDTSESFQIVPGGRIGEADILSGLESSGDSWEDDAQHRIAEFFLILDRWDRSLGVEEQGKGAA